MTALLFFFGPSVPASGRFVSVPSLCLTIPALPRHGGWSPRHPFFYRSTRPRLWPAHQEECYEKVYALFGLKNPGKKTGV